MTLNWGFLAQVMSSSIDEPRNVGGRPATGITKTKPPLSMNKDLWGRIKALAFNSNASASGWVEARLRKIVEEEEARASGESSNNSPASV